LPGEKKSVSLLPYHYSMVSKHEKLGQVFDGGAMSELTDNDKDQAVNLFSSFGLKVTVGG
jgi:hypothetical protein